MANLRIGDTIAEMFTALIRDGNTATPQRVTPKDIERVRLELNRLQAGERPVIHTYKGNDVASASNITLAGDSDYYHITGSTAIDTITARPLGDIVWLKFNAVNTLNHSANLIMKAAANRAVSVGEVIGFVSDGDGIWREMERRVNISNAVIGILPASNGGTGINNNGFNLTVPRTGVADQLIQVKNTSGATANANDVGYITAAGEYDTTTTAMDDVAWCVVIVGAANNSDVYVARRGTVSVNYTSTAPTAGQFLVTSTVAGSALAQATMRPEIFAVCTAAGSGGVVQALLLTQRKYQPFTSANNLLSILLASTSGFVATINGAPAGAVVTYNAPSSGSEDSIVPQTVNELGKIVLHNTTRGTKAYISSVNTGANTITVTSAGDISGWQSGDTITPESLVATDATLKFFDIKILSEIPDLTTAIAYQSSYLDTGAANLSLRMQPYVAVSNGVRRQVFTQAANVTNAGANTMPLIDKTFDVQWTASGAGTATTISRLLGVWVAAP